ncbi:NAD-dependent epimerase/dehydratase family protein, partial [Tenacibaculum maritimum]
NEYSVQTKIIHLRFPRILNTNEMNQLGFFGKIVHNYITGQEIVIANPNNNTNLIDIEDVSEAVKYLISKDLDNSVLNVSGENVSMREYCEEVKRQLPNKNDTIAYGEDETIRSSSMINGDRLLNLGWKPRKSLKNIVTAIIKNNN